MTRTTLLCSLGIWVLTGCAIGREHAYHTANPTLQPAGPGATWVAIAVHDQRSEVLSGDKTPDFVGLSRGGWGNPFDVSTVGEGPLSRDMATSIARGLKRAGYRVSVIELSPTMRGKQVMPKFRQTGASCLLVMRINHWKSDTYQDTALEYDIELFAMNTQGIQIGYAHQKGRDDLGGSAWNPPAHAEKAVPKAFEQKLVALFNDATIVRALQTPAVAAATTAVPSS